MTDRGLERRHPFIDLTRGEIEEMVAPVLGSDAIANITRLTSGRVNSNYRITLKESPYAAVLRLYARGAGVCRLERDVLKLVNGRVSAPEVLYDGSHARHPFLLLSWIEGEPLEAALANGRGTPDGLGAAAGRELANIHDISFPHAGFLGEGAQVETPMGGMSEEFLRFLMPALQGRAGARLGSGMASNVSRFSERMAPQLDRLPKCACLVHSDFNPPNLRVEGDRLTGVLDWEFAHAGNPLTDIANMLRPRTYQPDAFNAAFIAAYQEIAGELPENWDALSRLLDLMAQIELLDAPEDRPRIFAWARERIADTLEFVNSRLAKP